MTGKQLKQIIQQQGISQKYISKEICLSYTSLNSYLNGHTHISKSKYYRLCALLQQMGEDVLL
ncbi:helix-turn-helix domain-containing protein [Sutcliffiella horikoshii]|uniref:helix-turn-helix domain-containing protein n=1 Tax=Sutcliffiella horikoshii TaxID=79883 RepID=UPI00384FC41F